MSEAYERERQNNSRLDELSAKVSALRGVTIDIYDNARAQDVIDNTVRPFSFSTPIQSSRTEDKKLADMTKPPSPIPSPPCAPSSPAPQAAWAAWPPRATRSPS